MQRASLEAECQRRDKNVEVAGVVGSCVTEKERMAVTIWMLGDIFLKSHLVREVKSMGGGVEWPAEPGLFLEIGKRVVRITFLILSA